MGDLVPNDLSGPAVAGHDLADPGFWALPERVRLDAFARLRDRPGPVRFDGFSALVRHADVVAASRQPQLFLSGPGVATPDPPRWLRTATADSLTTLDDPRHGSLRSVVVSAFTPARLARIEAGIRETTVALVDEVDKHRPADFVTAVAAPLPYRVIGRMLDLPAADQDRILALLERAEDGTRWRAGTGLRALAELRRVTGRLARERRTAPADDLVSALVAGEGGLTDHELGAFVLLLLALGIGATRDAIAYGLWLLSEHPEERLLLLADPDAHVPGAVEEIVRLATPVPQLRRTLAREHLVGDRLLPAGDRVVLYYLSANRDERVFDEPDVFDVTRSPNPHLGFGGGGPHLCLGAELARRQLDLLLRELYDRLPNLRATAPPEFTATPTGVHVRRLPFTFD